MELADPDFCLTAAGVIGCVTAGFHGALVQRYFVRPARERAQGQPASIRRLIAPLLQFSTLEWFGGGIALILAAGVLDDGARSAVAVLVAASYTAGGVINLWATRGRSPGWLMMAAALALIAAGLRPAAS
ncbi:hypothetical protein [Arenibaculum pallidiluteum]|uniref:hypothetical protein n=1 Tax=Arenibaculum pallidiluteum TaxID=2812559 RepID=UPI001A973F9A|nr:hypothetical protein [Arenibaculum pallidiluteum]